MKSRYMPAFYLAVLLACWAAGGAEKATDPSWQEKMKSLAATMGELLPELLSSQGDPQIIEKGARTLSELSHDLREGRKSGKVMPPSDRDPSVLFLADQFSDQTHRAYTALQQGHTAYGKSLLRTVTSYCIACHTRHENGPDFSTFPLSERAQTLGKEEKAELFVATRQFDKGLAQFQELIADENLIKTRPFDWERPLRHALAIAVRVKRDPDAADKTVADALKLPSLPEFERANLLKWQQAIAAWKKEPVIKVNSQAGYAAEMKRLLREAGRAQLYPSDHSAEIQYLRASAAAHDVLRVGGDAKLNAQALRAAGAAYEVLANPTFWPIHELYYEACIRQVPHTDLALECYSKFEESVYFGYTGSAGTQVPPQIAQRLTDLKTLAAPSSGRARKK